MCGLVDDVVLVGAAAVTNHKVVAVAVVQGGRGVGLGLGPDLDPKPFCKSTWADNDGGGGKYWPKDLIKGPPGCVAGRDHDYGGG